MTKFEKAKIIGVRAVQISKNAPLYLNSDNIANMNWDPITIAEKELAEKCIPFIIRRYLPDGSFEDWKLNELKTFDWSLPIHQQSHPKLTVTTNLKSLGLKEEKREWIPLYVCLLGQSFHANVGLGIIVTVKMDI